MVMEKEFIVESDHAVNVMDQARNRNLEFQQQPLTLPFFG